MNKDIFTINNEFLNDCVKNEKTHYVTILLNRPLKLDLFERIKQVSDIVICADGGANRLYKLQQLRDSFVPNAIVGDLDSIQPEVRQFYEGKGVEIRQNHSLDDTDLEKSIHFLFEKDFFVTGNKKEELRVIILGAFGGRLDQTISNLSNLVKINKLFEDKKPFQKNTVQMMDHYSLATCLLPGEYHYQRAKKFEQTKGLGVLPLGNFNKGKIDSKGLRWDLDGLEFEFGSFLSTSNEFNDEYEGVPYFKTDSTIFVMTCINKDA